MPDTIRILHLVPAECDWEPAARIAGLAAGLREQGFTTMVTAPDHSRLREFAEAAGVEVLPYALSASINPMRWLELSRLVKESGAQILHAHNLEAAQLLSHTKRFLPDVRVVTSRYDLIKPPAAAEYGAGVDRVVCPSQALADAFIAQKAPAEKIAVVFDGVSLPAIDHAVEERDQLRTQLRDTFCPRKEKPLFVVNISPLDDDSRQADLLEAMAEIIAVLPQTQLFIMGEGPLKEDLSRQIRIMALEKNVTFMEPDKAFTRLLAAADLYVSPQVDDVSGLMVQAAMAAGRAVVLSASGCYPELAEDGKTAAFVAEPGAVALKDAMLELLENRTRREHLGRLAGARAAKAFNMTAQAGRTAEIYGECCT